MHSYSIDSSARRQSTIVLFLIASAMPSVVASVVEVLRGLIASQPAIAWPLSLSGTFAAVFFVFDRYAWRLRPLVALHGVPDLNGTWDAHGLSSYQQADDGSLTSAFEMTVTIRQTFSRMEIDTVTEHSTSRSTMASVASDHAVPVLRYSFENTPRSKAVAELQRHPGLVELRLNSDTEMVGDYFSGKHRLRYGELTLTRRKAS